MKPLLAMVLLLVSLLWGFTPAAQNRLVSGGDEASVQPDRFPERKAINLESVNSLQSDFGPAFKDGDLIFASRRLNEDYTVIADKNMHGYSDYYLAKYDKKKLTFRKPVRMKGNINGNFDDGGFSYCPQTRTAWLTKCEGSQGACSIYSAILKKQRWTKLKLLEIGDKKYNYAHPSVSPDGGTLWFTSDMPGGFGGKDIWRVTLSSSGDLVDLVNAGELVNTEKDEIFPFIMGDSLLFFASAGHAGLGGFDLFYSRIADNRFEQPVNPGGTVNSPADDFGLVAGPGKETWYFSSNRNQERSDDIFFTSGVITGKRAAPVPEDSRIPPVVAVKEPDKSVLEPEHQEVKTAKGISTESPVRDILNETELIVNPILTSRNYYRVQISAGIRLVDPAVQFRNIADLIDQYGLSVDKVGGLYKYRVGNVETRAEAQILQTGLKKRGYRDCFILEFPAE